MKAGRTKKRGATRTGGAAALQQRLRRTERRLREVEERHEIAMGAIREGVYDWDIAGNRVYFAGPLEGFLGLAPGVLKNSFKEWHERVHPEDFPRFREATISHLKGATQRFECDYRYRARDGTWHWARTHGLAVRDARGRAVRMIGSTGDITELKRSEQAQTATAEILRVISGSPTDVQPVFEAILTHASRLCEASFAAVFTFDGEVLRNVAHLNASPQFARFLGSGGVRPSRETTTRRCALERRTIHTADLMNDPEFSPPEAQRREKVRTSLSVPMFREGALVGVISLWRAEVRPFTGKQIALVETFAAQAVIAIENVRHFNQIRAALEQQKAIAEVLGVVTQLQTDVQPVFQAIGRNAARLCGALFSCVYRFDGELVHLVATHNLPAAAKEVGRTLYPMRPDRSQLSGRAVLTRSVQRLEDATQDAEYALHVADAGGWRRLLAVPMLREGEPLGVIAVGWRDPGPIPESRVELLKTFADQAVIAIEKVRLFNETKEALEQQTATAEILASISSSVTDTRPVFDAIVENVERLFGTRFVGLFLRDGSSIELVAHSREPRFAGIVASYPRPLDDQTIVGRSMMRSEVLQLAPIVGNPNAPARTQQYGRDFGYDSIIAAPLVRGGVVIGGIGAARDEALPFTEKQVALLKTFADQAVIAIQNVRLFQEIQEKSRQLEIASRHKSEFLANMSHELRTPLNAIIGFTRIVMRRSQEMLEPKQYENLEKILASGQTLLALINAILDLSKIEAGRIEVRTAETPLGPVLEQCLRTVEPLAKVALVKEFDGGLPTMYVDEEKLRQIVLNLLGNAAKFTETGAIRLKVQAQNGAVAIAVADTGIGIPADKLGLIFEEFEQVEASSTRTHGGTGLGLAIARRLARLMGGDIQAQSVLGSGSTFTLTLPLRYPA